MTPQEKREFEQLKREVQLLKQVQSVDFVDKLDSQLFLKVNNANTTDLLSSGTTDSMKMPAKVIVKKYKGQVGLIPFYGIENS